MIYILSCIPPQKWANLAAPADKEGPFKHQVRIPLNIVGGGGVLPWHSSKAKQNKTKFYKKVNGNNICPKRCFFCYRYILDTFFFFFFTVFVSSIWPCGKLWNETRTFYRCYKLKIKRKLQKRRFGPAPDLSGFLYFWCLKYFLMLCWSVTVRGNLWKQDPGMMLRPRTLVPIQKDQCGSQESNCPFLKYTKNNLIKRRLRMTKCVEKDFRFPL